MLASTVAIALGLALAANGPGADEHVLAGARLFRDGRYAEALVEFRVAERLGASDAAGYAAAALVKLGRPEQSLQIFESPGGPPPGRDALLDYYHALACYDARLYACADRLLGGVRERSGPRIAAQAAKLRAEIAALPAGEPPRDVIDWYLARCEEHQRGGRAALARAYCDEARGLAGRRSDRYGVAAVAQLTRATQEIVPGGSR